MKRVIGNRLVLAALSVSMAVVATACGSSSSSNSGSGSAAANTSAASAGSSSSGSTPVSVGTTTLKLPKGHMNIVFFMNAETNQFQEQLIKGAQAAATKAGDSLTVLNPNFDLNTQLDQVTNAATNHRFQAAVINPIDGNALCGPLTKTLPQAGIVVSVTTEQICNRQNSTTGVGMWAPGTLNYVGGDVSYPSIQAFVRKAGELNPGPQTVAVVQGATTAPAAIAEKKAFDAYAAAHPNFHIAAYIHTDYSTPSATRTRWPTCARIRTRL